MEISISELVSLLNQNTVMVVHEVMKQLTPTLKPETSQTEKCEISLPETEIVCCAGKMNIGENIKQIRTKQGITQIELAQAVNVNKSMIGLIETERKLPSLMLALDIAKVLGCTVEEMCKN